MGDLTFFEPGEIKEATGYHANPKRLLETSAHQKPGSRPALPSLWSMIAGRQWGLALISYPLIAYRARHFLIVLTLMKVVNKSSAKYGLRLLGEYMSFYLKRPFAAFRRPGGAKSLRKTMKNDLGPLSSDTPEMQLLRDGR